MPGIEGLKRGRSRLEAGLAPEGRLVAASWGYGETQACSRNGEGEVGDRTVSGLLRGG